MFDFEAPLQKEMIILEPCDREIDPKRQILLLTEHAHFIEGTKEQSHVIKRAHRNKTVIAR